MRNIMVTVSYPLCRDFEKGDLSSYSFESEIGKGTDVSTFLKAMGVKNPAFQSLLSTPGGPSTGLVAVTLNGQQLQFGSDFQRVLQHHDRVDLAVDWTGS